MGSLAASYPSQATMSVLKYKLLLYRTRRGILRRAVAKNSEALPISLNRVSISGFCAAIFQSE